MATHPLRRSAAAPALAAMLGAALSLGGCAEGGTPLSIDARGGLVGLAVIDRNGNEKVDNGVDVPAVNLQVTLLGGAGDTVGTATTGTGGVFRFPELPVGTYSVTVSPSALGDSLRVANVDSARVTVAASDTAAVTLTLGYPIVGAGEVSTLPAGRLVTVEGVALIASNLFGDSTLYVRDSTGVARAAGLAPGNRVAQGDSVRVVGRVGRWHERAAVVQPVARVIGGAGPLPAPLSVTSARAATAEGGTLDGRLVQVTGARILDVSKQATGDIRLRVNDGSGTLDVILDRNAGISTGDPLLNGVVLDVAGVLVPVADGSAWQLKPRSGTDLHARIPRMTVSEIRQQSTGTVVLLDAVALNGLSDFGDHSLHVADATGALRALGVQSTVVFAGDSVGVLGVVSVTGGQIVLSQDSVTVLGKSAVPAPRKVSTATAAGADGGALDAALVAVDSAKVVSVSSTFSGDVLLSVNDGSGKLGVLLDRDTGIGLNNYHSGDVLDVTGLLVPAGTAWQLKPRSPSDLKKR